MKFLVILSLLGLANAHWWQGSDSCGYVVGGSHDHVARDVRELDCSSYMRTTITPSYVASGYFQLLIHSIIYSTNSI